MMTMNDIPKLPPRDPDSHKGTYGRALLIGGSCGMTGSIALAGMAALRSGAGLVTVAVPESVLPIVAAYDPCLMTVPLPEHEDRIGQICCRHASTFSRMPTSRNASPLAPAWGAAKG